MRLPSLLPSRPQISRASTDDQTSGPDAASSHQVQVTTTRFPTYYQPSRSPSRAAPRVGFGSPGLASALPCVAFVFLAIVLLWNGAAISLLGVVVAATPMTLYVESVINPNGLEIASSLAFTAGMLRVARDPTSRPHWTWIALAVSGAVAILSWQLGPVFVTVDLVLGAALLARSGLKAILVNDRRGVITLAATLGTAALLYLVYALKAGLFHSTLQIRPIGQGLHLGLEQLSPVLHDAVFALVGVRAGLVVYVFWWSVVLVLSGIATAVGSRRERVIVLGAVAWALAFPVLFYAWVYRFTGFGLQGRYVLPSLMVVPLVAGEVICRHASTRDAKRASLLAAGAIAPIALAHLVVWWQNARDAAGKPNALWFLSDRVWRPPIGWWPWVALAVAGVIALLSVAVGAIYSGCRPPLQLEP